MRFLTSNSKRVAMGFCAGVIGLGLLATNSAAFANGAPSQSAAEDPIEGIYAGTFICASGEMGMTLAINFVGPATDGVREIGGILNFFPTSGNPDAPAGAFKVNGSADSNYDPATMIELAPTEWIDQPLGFGSSAMTATVYDGEMTGKPTAPGCYTLKMRKIAEG